MPGSLNEMLGDHRHVPLGGVYTNALDSLYYLLDNDEVWVHFSPGNSLRSSNRRLDSDELDRIVVDGKTLRQLVDERKGQMPSIPEKGPRGTPNWNWPRRSST